MKSHDYHIDVKLENGGVIGICEVKGGRKKQEDAICYDAGQSSQQFSKLDNAEKSTVMTATFVGLQLGLYTPELKDELKDKGSCVCAATGWIDDNKINMSTSYVGDSVAYMLVLDKENNLKYCAAANPGLHDLNNPNEVEAIQKGVDRSQEKIEAGQKILAGLAVTRALGDADFDGHGISHKPETTSLSFPYQEDDKVFMIVVCDGAMEHLKESGVAETFAAQLGDVVKEQMTATITAGQIAKSIEQNATKLGSRDNISVMVVPLQKNLSPVTAVVFDGHNGNEVSQKLSRDFNQKFQQVLNMTPGERAKAINDFDVVFKQNIQMSKAVESQPKTKEDKRKMLVKKDNQRSPTHKSEMPKDKPHDPQTKDPMINSTTSLNDNQQNTKPKPDMPKHKANLPDVTNNCILLTEIWLALKNNEKRTKSMESIYQILSVYRADKSTLNNIDVINKVADDIMKITSDKKQYGHLFSKKNDNMLHNIHNLMASIKNPKLDNEAKQRELTDLITENVSPHKSMHAKKG